MRYGKSWTDTLKEVQEQTGVRKVDFVDGITPDLQEAKPEFEVKYASSKKGPIKVTKFMSLKDAKKFLAQVKGEGMNGIISQNGKPVKEEKVECPKCKGEGCEHCDGKGYHMKEEVEINEADYELYHKTFSGAMQHAYAHAKKRGFIVDPDEIDNKVATGPKKPSSGKTNKYILGTNKKQKLHVQVANLDNKRYELNMYIEETEIDEKSMLPRPGAGAYKTPEQRKKDAETKKRLKMFKGLRDKKESVEEKLVGGQKKLDKDKDGDIDAKDFAMLRKSKKKSESKLYTHVKSMMKKEYANIKKMKNR